MRYKIASLAAAIVIGGVQMASAADMAVKARPMAAPVAMYNWTGFYIGINGGAVWARDHLTSDPADAGTTAFWAPCFAAGACPRDYGASNATGGVFGAQAGYNWQIQNWLIGIETDIQWAHASSTAAIALANTGTGFVPFNGQASSQLNWFGTTRARLGVLVTPPWLLYTTGGVAYGSIDRTWTANFPATAQLVTGTNKETAFGWTVGAGTEWMLAPNWILGAEYLYIKFSSHDFTATGLGSIGCTALNCNFNVHSSGLSASIARVKLSYKF